MELVNFFFIAVSKWYFFFKLWFANTKWWRSFPNANGNSKARKMETRRRRKRSDTAVAFRNIRTNASRPRLNFNFLHRQRRRESRSRRLDCSMHLTITIFVAENFSKIVSDQKNVALIAGWRWKDGSPGRLRDQRVNWVACFSVLPGNKKISSNNEIIM